MWVTYIAQNKVLLNNISKNFHKAPDLHIKVGRGKQRRAVTKVCGKIDGGCLSSPSFLSLLILSM